MVMILGIVTFEMMVLVFRGPVAVIAVVMLVLVGMTIVAVVVLMFTGVAIVAVMMLVFIGMAVIAVMMLVVRLMRFVRRVFGPDRRNGQTQRGSNSEGGQRTLDHAVSFSAGHGS